MSPRQYDGEIRLTDILDTRHRPTARNLHDGKRLLALAAEEEPPPAWPNLAELVDADTIDATVLAATERGDRTELAHLLVDLDDLRLRIALALQVLEDALIPLMNTKTLEIEGLPVLEQRGGKDRKAWHSDEVVGKVVSWAVAAVETEQNDRLSLQASEAVDAVVGALKSAAPFTASMGWRVTALRSMDIDPDEYCETSPSRRTVQIHRATQPAVIR